MTHPARSNYEAKLEAVLDAGAHLEAISSQPTCTESVEEVCVGL